MGPYRVAQWATGKVDRRVPIAILDHPELDPLGVYVHPPDKSASMPGTSTVRRSPESTCVVLRSEH